MILEVIVDLVFENHTTIAYEVHEAKGISSFGADREGIVGSLYVYGRLRDFRLDLSHPRLTLTPSP